MSEIIDKYHEPLAGDPVALSEEVKFEKKDLPEITPSSNESVSKEQEILELEKKLAEKKQELSQETIPEQKQEIIEKPEIIKEEPKESKEIVKEEVIPSTLTSKLSSKIKIQIKRIKELDRESQIKELCNLTFSEDLDFAVSVAKGLDSAYILDEFHDTLVDDLYDKLVEENKLKKI